MANQLIKVAIFSDVNERYLMTKVNKFYENLTVPIFVIAVNVYAPNHEYHCYSVTYYEK